MQFKLSQILLITLTLLSDPLCSTDQLKDQLNLGPKSAQSAAMNHVKSVSRGKFISFIRKHQETHVVRANIDDPNQVHFVESFLDVLENFLNKNDKKNWFLNYQDILSNLGGAAIIQKEFFESIFGAFYYEYCFRQPDFTNKIDLFKSNFYPYYRHLQLTINAVFEQLIKVGKLNKDLKYGVFECDQNSKTSNSCIGFFKGRGGYHTFTFAKNAPLDENNLLFATDQNSGLRAVILTDQGKFIEDRGLIIQPSAEKSLSIVATMYQEDPVNEPFLVGRTEFTIPQGNISYPIFLQMINSERLSNPDYPRKFIFALSRK